MAKIIDLIKVSVIIAYLLCGCTMKMRSGFYTIKAINGATTIQLKEVQGDWHIPNADSLKVGQRIYLNRSKVDSLINVW